MDKQNLIIFKFDSFYEIVKELEENLNFRIFKVSDVKDLHDKLEIFQNYLIVTRKKVVGDNNQLVLDKLPIKISNLIEKFNIQFQPLPTYFQ